MGIFLDRTNIEEYDAIPPAVKSKVVHSPTLPRRSFGDNVNDNMVQAQVMATKDIEKVAQLPSNHNVSSPAIHVC